MLIYMIKNLTNGKIYIGQTKKTIRHRYGSGCRSGNWWKYIKHNSHLSNAINLYGPEQFEISIIEHGLLSTDELDSREQYYIKQFDCVYPNGYNYTYGGQVNERKHSEHTRNEIAKIKSIGKTHTLLNNRTGEVTEFTNISRFARENKLLNPTVCRVLSGKYSRAGIWSLPKSPIKKIELTSPTGEKHIVMEGEIADFCRNKNLSQSNLSSVLYGEWHQVKGWSAKALFNTATKGTTHMGLRSNRNYNVHDPFLKDIPDSVDSLTYWRTR